MPAVQNVTPLSKTEASLLMMALKYKFLNAQVAME
jgi:hypothetical protein